jgi:very-short-patch-repair endonuclease
VERQVACFASEVRGMAKPPIDPKLLAFARAMRHEPTDAEAKLWQLLRNRRLAGFKFRRQIPIGGYVVDFYCHEANLGVELDGGQHNDDEGLKYDRGRTKALERSGVRIVRFWNPDVFRYTDVVLEHIYEMLTDSTLQPPSP